MKQEAYDFLKEVLPESFFQALQRKYRKGRSKLHKKISEAEFKTILQEELFVTRGSVVFIHSSVNNLLIDFPATKILSILRELVGDEGTLVFPTFHINIRAEEHLEKDPLFKVRQTPTTMGLLPELARRMKGAKRSLHPYYSVVAIGPLADELVSEHHLSPYPCSKQSPFYKLSIHGAIIIGIGVTAYQSLTFVHTTEDIMLDKFPLQTRTEKIFQARVLDYEKKEIIVPTLAPHYRIAHRNLKRYLNKYIPKTICKSMELSHISFFYCQAKPMLSLMIELATKRKTIYTKEAFKA